ncbi:MAG: hypothetical protein NE334_17655 [Lentisphaeraceae bacterium]|nr:hypothetical protein [Lentisphaeraceae bacterium]
MSYFDYPRLIFSGQFLCDPSTINNTPVNYRAVDGAIAEGQSKNPLTEMELFWNPAGTGEFAFENCVVKRVEYEDGTFAENAKEDPIIGQSVESVSSFLLKAAMADLDPRQQNVSEICGLTVNCGEGVFQGTFLQTPFNNIWGNAGNLASAIYQSKLVDVSFGTELSESRFVKDMNGKKELSLNFVPTCYNNQPQFYEFSETTFKQMVAQGVPEELLQKIEFFQELSSHPKDPNSPKGHIPTQRYVQQLLLQNWTPAEYNEYQERLFEITELPYPSSGYFTFDFSYGAIYGIIGPSSPTEPDYFVGSRAMYPTGEVSAEKNSYFYAYMKTSVMGGENVVHLNLGNALNPKPNPVSGPAGTELFKFKGTDNLYLVSFDDNSVDPSAGTKLHSSPLEIGADFALNKAGLINVKVNADVSKKRLGLVQENNGVSTLLLVENADGYFMRADRFVYRMNPGYDTSAVMDMGSTANVDVMVYKFGEAVADEEVFLKQMSSNAATSYTNQTVGTGGTNGIADLEKPSEALIISKDSLKTDSNGRARFRLSCTDPTDWDGMDGQVYILKYGFSDDKLNKSYQKPKDDKVSIHVYSSNPTRTGKELLLEYGEIYPVMSWLQNEEKLQEKKGMIMNVLQQPINSVAHMPVSRDLSLAKRDKILAWLNEL